MSLCPFFYQNKWPYFFFCSHEAFTDRAHHFPALFDPATFEVRMASVITATQFRNTMKDFQETCRAH